LWSLGGLIFSTHDIEWVRGNEGRSTEESPSIALETVAISPAQAARAAGFQSVLEVRLGTVLGRPVYEVQSPANWTLVDAVSGEVLSPLSESMAMAIAQADRAFETRVVDTLFLTENPEVEYREKPLPAWRLDLDDTDNTHIYVDASTTRITARRNDAWRRFDFFWMLHTMDYSSRDDFNTRWLILFASLGLFSVLSGWTLWLFRIRKRGRVEHAPPPS
jgi:hypothetical protein